MRLPTTTSKYRNYNRQFVVFRTIMNLNEQFDKNNESQEHASIKAQKKIPKKYIQFSIPYSPENFFLSPENRIRQKKFHLPIVEFQGLLAFAVNFREGKFLPTNKLSNPPNPCNLPKPYGLQHSGLQLVIL